ncbi:MAG TPA: SDR family oxidoreductase [Egibacteraceae bacterium]|jgi:NAD(P)-dependent dehydrogenase (short-subunit alcohol dehydrogenase family)|nr:SDR family oxidoreductase [Egibacteraceae bacterium]
MPSPIRVALVTGGSLGLGRALVASLAADGWTVVTDGRDAAALAAATAHPAVHGVPGDVTDEDHRIALVQAVDDLGGLDLLVNNASLLGPSPQPTLADYPLGVLEAVYRTNVLAPLRLVQLALPRLRPGGAIIAISSDAAREAYPGWGGYGSSKAALEQLTAVLGEEQPQLRVYAVDPGDMNTRMQAEAFPGGDISDRPPPEASVPGIRRLVDGDLPSGRYEARALAGSAVGAR